MNKSATDLSTLLRSMEPVRQAGVYAFCSVAHATDVAALSPVATVREAEGLTVIVTEEQALAAGLPVLFRAAWITLSVHSDLHAVGLTAAFSGALAQAGISCNVVAGAFHDHLFVPVEAAARALEVLRVLQRGSRA